MARLAEVLNPARGKLSYVLAGALFLVGAVVMSWPTVTYLSTGLWSVDDSLLNSWILAWDVHALTTDPRHLFDANIYFPFPLPLTYSDTLLSGAILIAPIFLLTGNPVLAHNVLLLTSLALTGFATYLLARQLTGHALGSIVGGCIFAFAPYIHDQYGHVQLLQTGWLSLALLFLHRALRHGKLRDYLLFALIFVVEAFASFYLLMMESLVLAVFLSFEAATSRQFWRPSQLLRLGGSGVLIAACLVPLALPYRQTQLTFSSGIWTLDLLQAMSATPGNYLSVSPLKLWAPDFLAGFTATSMPGEGNLYPGLVTAVLAVLGIALGWRRREPLRYGLIALAGVAMSFGPGVITVGSLKIPTPYQLAYAYIPGFASLRFPLRYELVVLLGLGVLAAYGVAGLDALLRLPASSRVRHVSIAGVALLVLADLLTVHKPLVTIPTGSAVPPVYSWLQAQDPSAVVAEIPNDYLARFRYVYFSTYHWHPLVNGVSGLNPPQYADLSTQLDAFPRPDSVENLRSLGVRYLVAHRGALDPNSLQQLDGADLQGLQMHVAATFGSDVVYELNPRADTTTGNSQARIELPSVIARNVPPSAALNIANTGRFPLINVPRSTQLTFQLNGSTDHTHQSLDLPLFLEPGDTFVRPLPIPVDVQTLPGDQVQVRVDVTGSLTLSSSATVPLANLTTSQQKTGLAGRLTSIQLPTVVHANDRVPIRLVASNIGQSVWLAGSDAGVVGVVVREWDDANGKPTAGPAGASLVTSSPVGWNVAPGQSASVTLMASTPPQPGAYNLVLDMVSEDVAFFDDVQGGGARTVVPVVVD